MSDPRSTSTSTESTRDLNWLLDNFAGSVPGVNHAAVVSTDGLLLAVSERFSKERADQLAAVTSGLSSLTQGAARIFEAGSVTQTIVEMEAGFLFVMTISDGSCLAVLASAESDMGLVAYEMATLVERVGRVLTPALRHQPQGTSGRG